MTFSGGISEAMNKAGGGIQQNSGSSQVLEYIVQPQEFTMLRTGGDESDYEIDSIIFQGGRRWLIPTKDGNAPRNFIRHAFSQRGEKHPA